MILVAIPSKGRLREAVLDVLDRAGYQTSGLAGAAASTETGDVGFIEMRPRDAAAWLAAGRLDAAFISTDAALENHIEDFPTLELGFSRSTMIVACRDDSPYENAADLAGKTIATHLPDWTRRWFDSRGIEVTIVAMGGSLEGICAQGLADAIVDLRETGRSLTRNSLHAIEEITPCQAVFTMTETDDPATHGALSAMALRLTAADTATKRQYLVLHIHPDKVNQLGAVFPGLAAPTILPLAGREDLVAVHIVVNKADLWPNLSTLQQLGASGIVALPTEAIVE
ncbi:MAG: ATP phosphoribosyltransferase [Actinomycetota bacterium]